MPSTSTTRKRRRRRSAKIGASLRDYAKKRSEAPRRRKPERPAAPRYEGRLTKRKARKLAASIPASLSRAYLGHTEDGYQAYLLPDRLPRYIGPSFGSGIRGLRSGLALVRAYNEANQDRWVFEDGTPRGDHLKPHGFYKRWRPRRRKKPATDTPPKRKRTRKTKT